jgi:hypothetical protein
MITQSTTPTVHEKLAAWQQFFLDAALEPTIDRFGQGVAAELLEFRAANSSAQIGYHSHMHMAKGVAICYQIGKANFLWLSVFPDTEEFKNHRATVCMARRSLQAKVDGCAICKTPSEAAQAIIGEVHRVCKISVN